ncbi:MAG: hypothetical protein IKZ12_06865 [Alistipes sp.]|nr:hypothetical protein [Alistipes sp.]
MQQLKSRWYKLLAVVAVVFLTTNALAQTSSINAFSPYTMYGIGEINTPGTLQIRSMGGAGVAMRQVGAINLLNPASFSLVSRKSFMLDFGMEGQNYYNKQTAEGVAKKSAYNSFNIREFAFLMPLYKNLGLAFSVTPYSSVGYRMNYDHHYDPNDPVWGNVGRVNYSYQGEGDVTEVKLGLGYELFKNFSLGVAAQYYWGDIDRTFSMYPVSIVGGSSHGQVVGESQYAISRIKGQVGFQWNVLETSRRLLTIGATYDLGGDLSPEVSTDIYANDLYNTTVQGDTTHLEMRLPRQVAVGVSYQTSQWLLSADYVYQDWASNGRTELTGANAVTGASMQVRYVDTHMLRFGVELTPGRYDVRRFWKRWSYRAGLRFGTHNQSFDGQKLNEMAATLGMRVPFKFMGVSSVDLGVEYGRRGYNVAERVGLVRQEYFKFAIGFTLFASATENHEYWFMRPKYD